MKDIVDLIARICIALIFLWEAWDSITHYQDTKELMAGYNITAAQDFLLVSAIILMIVGGALVLTGYRSGFGAVLLLLFYIPSTLVMYSWWNDPIEIQREVSILFMKNIAIIGGLLMLYVNGSGRYSIKRLFATTRVP
ncbi:MAG: putative oxidoreductase [Polaribacter sp.]|jgi:putative oxidoreductase